MNYSESDLMTIAIARELKDKESVFHGLASTLPHIAIKFAHECYNKNLNYVNITGGYNVYPKKFRISTDGDNLFNGTKCRYGLTDIFDMSARGDLDTAFLSGVQIDSFGNLNNSVIGNDFRKPKVKLPGGAGSAVLVPNAKRSLIWRTKHNRRTFVEKVDFITSKGNVDKVFTPLCIFEKRNNKLELAVLYPKVEYETIVKNTGFEIGNKYEVMDPITEKEYKILNSIDPYRVRDSEFK